MKKILLIDCVCDYQRVALLENNQLKEFYFNNKNQFNIGDIIIAKVKKIFKNKFIFLDVGLEKNAFLFLKDNKEKSLFNFENNKSILKIKEGQSLLVQIEKVGNDLKGIVVTSKISLVGKYSIVFSGDNNIGISKKIDENYNQLKNMVKCILPKNFGAILRTNCKNVSFNFIEEEILTLSKKLSSIIEKANHINSPCVVYKSKNIYENIIIDSLNENDEVYINNFDEYNKIKLNTNFKNLNFYSKSLPLFKAFSAENQIDKIFKNKIWLKSGGFIFIDCTEAMTIIDVNSGKNITKNYDKMVLKTNLEAIEEVAKQIRLRNLSGIILVDLIDIKKDEDKKTIILKMQELAKLDRQPICVHSITELGILQITRKKSSYQIYQSIMNKCKNCCGSGIVKTKEFVAIQIKNKIFSIISSTNFKNIRITANKAVIQILKNFNILELENNFNIKINFNNVDNQKLDYFEIEKY